MTGLMIWTTRQRIRVDAPPKRVFELVANVGCWPVIFDSLVAAERLDFDGVRERIRFSERAGRTWTSVRETNPKRMQVRFRQLDPPAPYASMGGLWVVAPKAADAVVAFDHYYRVADDSQATAAMLAEEISANSAAMLGTLRTAVELGGTAPLLASCSDSVATEREAS